MKTDEYITDLQRQLQDAIRNKQHHEEQAQKANRRALMLQAKIDGAQ